MEPWEVWNEILERAGDSKTHLTANERIIYRVNSFLCDVEMVGLSGFLYNVSPASDRSWSDLRETAEALETVGHAGCAAILRDLATRLERLPFDAAATWGALLDPLAEHLEADVSPVVESHIEDLYSRLEAFTKQHFGGGTGS